MSKAADGVREQISKYIGVMEDLGRKPSKIHITPKQFDALRSEFVKSLQSKGVVKEKQIENFRPRFRGYELIVYDQ